MKLCLKFSTPTRLDYHNGQIAKLNSSLFLSSFTRPLLRGYSARLLCTAILYGHLYETELCGRTWTTTLCGHSTQLFYAAILCGYSMRPFYAAIFRGHFVQLLYAAILYGHSVQLLCSATLYGCSAWLLYAAFLSSCFDDLLTKPPYKRANSALLHLV